MIVKWRDLVIVDSTGLEHSGEAARTWVATNLPKLLKGMDKAKKDHLTLNADDKTVGHAAAWRLLKEEVEKASARVYHPTLHKRPKDAPLISSGASKPPSMVRREAVTVIAQPKPLYKLTLELGDIDALFDPIAGGTDPWKETGVLQRLQVLGYLYTPLGHPNLSSPLAGAPFRKDGPAQVCWEYFKKRVHKTDDDAAAIEILKNEVKGNIVAAGHPVSGQVFAAATLPNPSQFAAIRLPGGYGTTCSPVTGLRGGDHYFNNSAASAGAAAYDFKIGYRRSDIEDKVWSENPLLGKIPLIGKVVAEYPDGRVTPVPDAPVYFQLTPPDSHSGTQFAPPALPDKVMNYSLSGLYWRRNVFPVQNTENGGLTPAEWEGVWRITRKAWDEEKDRGRAKTKADGWIDAWSAPADVPWDAVKEWWEGAGVQPYGRLTQPAEMVIGGIDNVLRKMGTLTPVPDLPPASVAPFQMKLARLNANEFKWAWRLIKNANDKAAAASKTPKDLATEWINTWAAVPAVTHAQIQNWWTDAGETPYPSIRSSMIANAKARVDFLLDQKDQDALRVAEVPHAGQRKYVDDLLAALERTANSVDPQKKNAPQARGGKQGMTIDAVLETPGAPRRGFHTATKYGDLLLATMPADTVKHHDAVQCKTNATGYAGVIFMPSRCGGDSYRLHAYIDDDWLKAKSNGPAHEASAGTGTLVVWRNIRIYRYLQMRNPLQPYSPGLTEILSHGKYPPSAEEYRGMGLDTDVVDLALLPGVATEAEEYAEGDPGELLKTGARSEQLKFRSMRVQVNGLDTQLKWGYCELLADCAGKETLTNGERRDATDFARNALQRWWAAQGYGPIDWDTLFGFPLGAPAVDATSPFLLNLRTFTHYNSLVAKPAFADLSTDTDTDKDHFTKGLQVFFEAMMEFFAGSGVLPGITVVQIPRGDNWDIRAGYVTGTATITSGYGTGARGFYISHTKSVYHGIFRIYPCTSNAIHELGHVLGFAHQPPAGADLARPHQTAVMDSFQTPTPDQCVCVMSYSGCYGDLCGACILSLRGWKQEQTDTDIRALYGI